MKRVAPAAFVEKSTAPPLAKALRTPVRIALWTFATFAATELAGAVLAKNPIGAAAIQAAAAEWGAGRIAVTWSDPLAPEPSVGAVARRGVVGLALGVGAAAFAASLMLLTGAAALRPGPAAIGQVAFGLLVPMLHSVRDELLLRGALLRLLGSIVPPGVAYVPCGLASAALALGEGKSPVQVIVAGLLGVAFAALWRVDRGAWLAVGAHTGWLWATSTLLAGGLVDVRTAASRWGGGDTGFDGGLACLGAVFVVATAASAFSLRHARSADEPPPRENDATRSG